MTDREDAPRWLLTIEGGMLEAIGRATVHFGHLEEELDQFIWSLVAGFDAITAAADSRGGRRSYEAQKVGQAMTARLTFRGKVDMMVALATQRFAGDPGVMSVVDSLQEALEAAAKQRNRVVHAVWSGSSTGPIPIPPGAAMSSKTCLIDGEGMRQNVAVHTQEDVARLADGFSQLGFRLAQLRGRLLPNSSAAPSGDAA